MGLDMYLYGRKSDFSYISGRYDETKVGATQDGFPVAYVELSLGYWRKHSDLHGYIVKTFADGVDKCQRIELEAEDVEKLIGAVRAHELPNTEGFFFGRSARVGRDPEAAIAEQDKEDLGILEATLTWMKGAPSGEHRTAIYQASW